MLSPRATSQRRTLESLAAMSMTTSVASYIESRGLLPVADQLRFGAVPASAKGRLSQYAGRLVIPSIGPRGNVYDVAFRCIQDHDCGAEGCPKYLFLPGMGKRLYNLQAVTQSSGTLEICEGQLDAATLVACGLHAVGVAGVNGWKHHHRRLFGGFDRVRVWGDGDPKGRDFADRVCHDVAGSDVMMVPFGEDLNSLFVSKGRDAILEIAEGEDENVDEELDEWGFDSDRPPY